MRRPNVRLAFALAVLALIPGDSRAQDQAPDPPPGIRVERLERLADFEELLEPRRVDLNLWTNGKTPDDPGFVGCSLAWAASLFKADGLTLEDGIPTYRGMTGVTAGSAFFGLSYREAERLFGGSARTLDTPKDIARRIRSVANLERERLAARNRPPRIILVVMGW